MEELETEALAVAQTAASFRNQNAVNRDAVTTCGNVRAEQWEQDIQGRGQRRMAASGRCCIAGQNKDLLCA